MRIDEIQPHTPFELRDFWSSDAALRHVLARHLAMAGASSELWSELSTRLAAFSRAVHDEARPLAALCDRPGAKPRLVQFDEWGRRIDRVETSEGWRRLMEWQNQHGLIGEAFGKECQEDALHSHPSSASLAKASAGGRDRLGPLARTYNFARLFLFSPECQVSLCPTSMTDGAVRVLELYGTPQQKQRYMPQLLSRDYTKSWQAGQWMTEVAGGSDVSMTETIARPLMTRQRGQVAKPGDLFAIYGFKWFSSAIDGHVSLALARTDPDRSKGSRGLSLFLIPLHKKNRPAIPPNVDYVDETAPSSIFNGIKVHRLKNKLGTQHVPTAELELCGALGELVGKEGRGVAQIAQVLNITRIFTANGSLSSMGRGLKIVQSYSHRRKVGAAHAGGADSILLKDLPMHNALVSGVTINYRALLQLLWRTTILLGQNETSSKDEQAQRVGRRLRLLTPVIKAFTSVRASESLTQLIECMGGQGYMEENQLTTLLRDDLVGRIWEGTPSVLSLDVARIHAQSKGAVLQEWIEDNQKELRAARSQLGSSMLFAQTADTLQQTMSEMQAVYLDKRALIPQQTPRQASDAHLDDTRLARTLMELVAIVECGTQLLAQAAWSSTAPTVDHGNADVEVNIAHRWVCGHEGRLPAVRAQLSLLAQGRSDPQLDKAIVYDEGLALASVMSPDGAAVSSEVTTTSRDVSGRMPLPPLTARSRM